MPMPKEAPIPELPRKALEEATPGVPAAKQPMAGPAKDNPAGLWSRLSSANEGSGDPQQKAIRATAAYLGVEGASLAAFDAAARQSIQELELAVTVRQQELLAPVPEGLTRQGQIELSRLSDARYDAARRRALGWMEPYLNRSSGHQEFRRDFDTWATTLSTTARGGGR